jgi:hypothetical protein
MSAWPSMCCQERRKGMLGTILADLGCQRHRQH